MGTNHPNCLTCGHSKWYNFHKHHIAGKDYDEDATEFFCTLCHGDRTEEQHDHPPAISRSKKKSAAECEARYDLGLADILAAMASFLTSDEVKLIDEKYLIALSKFLERRVGELRRLGTATIDELRKAASRKGGQQKQPGGK